MIAQLISFFLLISFGPFPQKAMTTQAAPPKIGDAAPEIVLEAFLQAPPNAPADLKPAQGKVVILELWATWCGPCIPAMDHLGKLKEKFENNPVQIIAVTSEDQKDVVRFLKHRPSRLWIGIDSDRSVFDTFQPMTIPHTIVIDKSGRIAAVTSPDQVTEQVIENLLAEKAIDLPVKASGYSEDAAEEAFEQRQMRLDSDTIFKAVFRPLKSESAWGRRYPADDPQFPLRRFTGKGIWPLALLAAAYESPVNLFIDEVGLPQSGYFIDVIVPQGKERLLNPTIQRLIQDGLNIRIEKETREVDVWELRKIQGAQAALQPSHAEKPLYTFRGPKLTAIKQPISRLVDYISNAGRKPVVDETGLTAEYDFSMDFVMGNKETFYEALRKLGLEIVESKRPIEMFVIRPESK